MLELGNIKIDSPERPTAKKYFTDLGIQHTSFDINGQDGAIPVDLSQPVDPSYYQQFDIVTNFGTSEHISDQFTVFENIHDCCVDGGFMVHSIPLEGYWKDHCPYHYKKGFPEELARLNNYEIVHSKISPRRRNFLVNFVARKLPQKTDSFIFPGGQVTYTYSYKKNEDNLF